MNFDDFMGLQILLDIVFAVVIFYGAAELRGYRRMVQLMTADSRAVPTCPKLIAEWAAKRDTYKKASPHWLAYTKRLKEVGYEK